MTTTTIAADGTITTIDDTTALTASGRPPAPAAPHDDASGPAFLLGLIAGVLLILLVQAWQRSRARAGDRAAAIGPRPAGDGMATEVAALARRTAALETIVTDPGLRTAREIDALR